MGRSKKFNYQAVIENNLIANSDGLTLDQLLERSGLKVDRSTLFRHLARLIETGRAERIGNARASRYRALGLARIAADAEPPSNQRPLVQHVPESPESHLPKATPFLSPSDVPQLHQTGRAKPDRVPVGMPEYGEVVKKAVRTIVREWKRFSRVNLQIYLSLLVLPEHLNEVAETVEQELAGLHEGNLAGFGLSPAEFAGFTPPASREVTGE